MDEFKDILLPLSSAWLVGSLIGLERSFRGRPAGFRTHALVALASAMLMLLTTQQQEWLTAMSEETIRADPTRMAQGIMTGIGFLGAGVIFKEGINVRGLTTAASIWATASVGILLGVGLYPAAGAATAIIVITLSLFHYVEAWLPTQNYVHLNLRFDREQKPDADRLRAVLKEAGYGISDTGMRVHDAGRQVDYRMIVRTKHRDNAASLAAHLDSLAGLHEFRISRAGY